MTETRTDGVEAVSKIDAARRQLRTAIRMFFDEADAVALYTLAGAAHELLRDLTGRTGSFIKDADFIVPERRKELIDIFNEPRNFFKHADADRDGVLAFRPGVTQYWLLDAAFMYHKVTGRMLREGYVLVFWFMINDPGLLLPSPVLTQILEAVAVLRTLAPNEPTLSKEMVRLVLLREWDLARLLPNMD